MQKKKSLVYGIMRADELIKRTVFTACCALTVYACVDILIIKQLKNRPAAVIKKMQDKKTEFAAAPKAQERITVAIDIADAPQHTGEYVKLRAKVMLAKDTGKVTFLNFSRNYKEGMVLVIFAKDYKRFTQKPALLYKDKMIEVEGRLKTYRGRPEIIVKSMDQIRLLPDN